MASIAEPVVAADRAYEIAELAEAVADEHCPPGRVVPEQIASRKRITLSFGHYGESFDGLLEHQAGRFHIYANLDRLDRPDSPRARFTLAHELGHYYIDEHRIALAEARVPAHRSVCAYESSNLAEQEADRFAASLLMPAGRFLPKARAGVPGLGAVIRLADQFGTSITSAAIRCADLDLWPCSVVKWDWRGFAWKRLSSRAFEARYRRTVESPRALAEGSPTWRSLRGEHPPAEGYFQAGTLAAAWFPAVAQGSLRDVIFIEQAMPLGRFGVLTFLYPASGQ